MNIQGAECTWENKYMNACQRDLQHEELLVKTQGSICMLNWMRAPDASSADSWFHIPEGLGYPKVS